MSCFLPASYAQVELPAAADLLAILKAVGAHPSMASYVDGRLRVRGIAQSALDAAAATADPFAAQRSGKKQAAAAELQRRVAAGMPYLGRVLQVDEASQGRIVAKAFEATIAPPGSGWSVQWRMADNTSLTLDVQGMKDLAAAAAGYVTGLRARYWQIVDQATAAAGEPELNAVDPLAGWPVVTSTSQATGGQALQAGAAIQPGSVTVTPAG